MPRDNEKIIEILDEAERLLKGRFKELIDCGASYPVLDRFMDALRAVNSASLSMGDDSDSGIPCPIMLRHSALLREPMQMSAGYVVRMDAGEVDSLQEQNGDAKCEITPPSH